MQPGAVQGDVGTYPQHLSGVGGTGGELTPHPGSPWAKGHVQLRSPQVPEGKERQEESGGGARAGAHCFFSRVVMVTSCLAALAMS